MRKPWVNEPRASLARSETEQPDKYFAEDRKRLADVRQLYRQAR